MKISNILKLLTVVILTTGLFSCNDMDEFHEKYVENGEVNYSKKLDSLYSRAGNERIEFTAFISDAFNVKNIEILWDKGKQSKSFDYVKKYKTDTLKMLIDEIVEGPYEFEIQSKDADGNTSVKSLVFASTYGEGYQKYLEPRFIDGFSFDGTNGILNLSIAAESDRGTEVTYTNTANETVSITVPQDIASVELNNLSPSDLVKYRTLHVPEVTALDSFRSNWKDYVIPPLMEILESVTATPVLGGVEFAWNNAEQTEIDVKIEYIGADGTTIKTSDFESADINGVAIVSSMSDSEQVVKVTISDLLGNSFGPSLFTTAPKPAVKIDKAEWTVIDFSSEEPKEADWGPEIQGLAAAAIDDDIDTFWHSAWELSQPDYPHHFTVDMGKQVTIASFECFRRQGNGSGATKQKFEVSTDNTTWVDLGTFDFDNQSNDGQITAIPSNPEVRYFRYTATEGPENFTNLAEISIYGAE